MSAARCGAGTVDLEHEEEALWAQRDEGYSVDLEPALLGAKVLHAIRRELRARVRPRIGTTH